jgi:alanine racemase
LSSAELKSISLSRPTWAEVSLPALRQNYWIIARHVAPSAICAVVKCDAYGHGVVQCARALEEEGAEWLGVTSAEEGLRLREAGVTCQILVMTGFWRGEEEAIIAGRLTAAVWTLEHVELLERAARRYRSGKLPVHLKIDTGMGRLGLPFAELQKMASRIAASPSLELEGVCSHLASSEVLGAQDTAAQIVRFSQVRELLRSAGLQPRYRHLANTAAIIGRPETWDNMVRPGLVLYGYNLPYAVPADFDEQQIPKPLPVTPVMTWKTRIVSLREFPAGQPIGYNGTFVTRAPSRIAVVPVGYGDGFFRAMSNKGRVIVRQQYAPLVGNISMDLSTIDVTGIAGAELGDEVLLIGASGQCSVTAADQARWAGTIPYEITCGLAPRVPRIYLQ